MLNLEKHLKDSYIYRLNLDYKNLNSIAIAEKAVELSKEFRKTEYSFYTENKSSYLFNLNLKNLSREIYFYNKFLNKNESKINNNFDSIENELKNLGKTLIESEQKLYKNKRMVLQNLKESERISLFEEVDFNDLENFKDPGSSLKYFNNRNICNIKHNLLKLPIKKTVLVEYEFSQIDKNNSTPGVIKRDVSNLNDSNSSFQYIANTSKNIGSELCLKLRFSHKEKINELVFNDGSTYPIFIKKIENEKKEEISFKSIQRGIKEIINFEEAQSVKILYVYFVQNKAISYGNENESSLKDLINSSYLNEQVFLKKKIENKFMYEFTISNLDVYRNSYKLEGLFRYSKPIKATSLNDIKIKTNYYLDTDSVELEYYLEISNYENEFCYENGLKSNVSTVKYPATNYVYIHESDAIQEIKLIAILRSKVSNIYNSDFIKSIDIDIF